MDNRAIRFENVFLQNYCSGLLDLSDGKLRTEDGHSFDIHRFMLARSSDYFHALFCGIGKGRKDIIIPGIRGDILDTILTYIYTSNLHLTKTNLCELLVAADYLILTELVTDIRKQLFCHLSISNGLSLFVASMQMQYTDIQRESSRCVQMYFEAIVQDDDSEFSDLPVEVIKKVLSWNLRVKGENTVWLAIVKWVQADIFSRQSEVPDLLMNLTIRDVDETLSCTILEHSIVANNPFCKEINDMKLSNSFTTNFGILFRYFWNHSQPILPLYRIRQPTYLNFIGRFCYESQLYQIYVTYDENIDVMRKVIELDMFPSFLMCLGSNLYIFDYRRNNCHYYNLEDKVLVEMFNFRPFEGEDCIVKLEEMLYVLRVIFTNHEEMNEAKVYDRERNVWSEVAPMIPVRSFSAVAFRKSIFVIGNIPMELDMVAQMYDQETDTWLLLPSPEIARYNFAVVVYHERIFVLGGRNYSGYLKAVEIFHPSKNAWTTEKELPYPYYRPEALVLSDKIIVYDTACQWMINSPVLWIDELECWVTVESSSPFNDLLNYQFCTLDSPECINSISRENKEFKEGFLKSPF